MAEAATVPATRSIEPAGSRVAATLKSTVDPKALRAEAAQAVRLGQISYLTASSARSDPVANAGKRSAGRFFSSVILSRRPLRQQPFRGIPRTDVFEPDSHSTQAGVNEACDGSIGLWIMPRIAQHIA